MPSTDTEAQIHEHRYTHQSYIDTTLYTLKHRRKQQPLLSYTRSRSVSQALMALDLGSFCAILSSFSFVFFCPLSLSLICCHSLSAPTCLDLLLALTQTRLQQPTTLSDLVTCEARRSSRPESNNFSQVTSSQKEMLRRHVSDTVTGVFPEEAEPAEAAQQARILSSSTLGWRRRDLLEVRTRTIELRKCVRRSGSYKGKCFKDALASSLQESFI